jgi:hypothetical protein
MAALEEGAWWSCSWSWAPGPGAHGRRAEVTHGRKWCRSAAVGACGWRASSHGSAQGSSYRATSSPERGDRLPYTSWTPAPRVREEDWGGASVTWTGAGASVLASLGDDELGTAPEVVSSTSTRRRACSRLLTSAPPAAGLPRSCRCPHPPGRVWLLKDFQDAGDGAPCGRGGGGWRDLQVRRHM